MEIKKIKKVSSVILAICVAYVGYAQTEKFDRTGTIRAQGNLASGYLFNQKEFGAYIVANVDVYVAPKVSIMGEGWYGFNLHNDQTGIRGNHAVFAGINYHFIRHKNWDPYIGFSPGVGMVVAGYADSMALRQSRLMVGPLLSLDAGCNWYIGAIFNIFINLRFVSGQVMGEPPTATRLEELKLSAGLGWNFRAWKRKKGQKWWEP